MKYNFTVSPDFPPERIASWYIFNTWLQKKLDIAVHLELHNNFKELQASIDNDAVDIIYTNPFEAAGLVRDKGFMPVATPQGISDEAVIVVAADSDVDKVEDLKPGVKVALTDDQDVNMISMMMLEPAELNKDNIELSNQDNYVLVAKQLMNKKADVGFFYKAAYDELSGMIKSQLKPLVTSEISVIKHMFLVSPRFKEHHAALQEALVTMSDDDKGKQIVTDLGFEAWDKQTQEETEFMIDLMDTLK
ncbi:phosphate/phosphite/phosphonate ABC transporter substrate-binding protein [Marinicella gelatinilytica]|uniref:phosphate/phosphite/phosphonate ABC transporter substrate-binding protein n=1 Tax=Marinicella gelatinilytica TaxID=2996017 RepID=UPI002260BFAC|nr:phosphate/phosphite/phosphonate ABC transporter substrate-binding protein [Marinicella gelatinilytica]MCX7546128.1 phosphate/phosphite/phosphonate ABC transporter substrate-binding protein [Marinicella gelatinilytica]